MDVNKVLLLSKPPAAAFSPLSLSPAAWYDFSDLTTLFTDAARTTPVTADGDVIGGVTDKSGNGFHATQATTANKPLWKAAIQNGRGVARLDGVNDYLSVSISLAAGSLTVFMAVNPNSVISTYKYFFDRMDFLLW